MNEDKLGSRSTDVRFDPVSLIATALTVLAGRKDMPGNDLMGLIAWLKGNPGKTLAGTGGAGSLAHIFLESNFRSPQARAFSLCHFAVLPRLEPP